MSQLKFSLNSFCELDLPELLTNIWSYADHIMNNVDGCEICEIYTEYCVSAVKEKWSEFYIDFDFGKFSTATKNNIYLHIAKTKVKTPRGTWKVLFEEKFVIPYCLNKQL